MFQSTTKGLLHFEDLDPKMFEVMYRNILATSENYEPEIKSHGIEGSDDGVDILCVEKSSKLKNFIQCKRYKKLSSSDLKEIVDRIVKKNKNDFHGNIITIVTSCNIRREALDGFEEYALEKGFLKAVFIGQVDLDSLLHLEKYERVKARFFGSEDSKELRARKKLQDIKVGRQLVKTKLMRPILENPTHEQIMRLLDDPTLKFKEPEVLVRSIYDDVYPDSNEDGEPSSWFKSFLNDTYNDGIQLNILCWTYETIVINPIGEWMLLKDFEKISYEGETLQLKVNIIGRIPFYNIVEIDEDGDNYYPFPHLHCIFTKENGPYAEICYEYYDTETHKRIMFEKGHRAWINEYDFQQLKAKIEDQNKKDLD